MSAPTRYPLAWPNGRPRTRQRRRGTFSVSTGGKARQVTITAAADRLEAEIEKLGGVYPLLSSNLETRIDGRPRADRATPADPGVCVYFQLKGAPYVLACDTFDEVAQNIAALAAHIEATRRIERYGVASAAETLQAFAALPPPGPPPARPWWEVLGLAPNIGDLLHTPELRRTVIQTVWKDLALNAHPDRGGSDAIMAELNAARAEALKALGL
jgi:hypothetical protein